MTAAIATEPSPAENKITYRKSTQTQKIYTAESCMTSQTTLIRYLRRTRFYPYPKNCVLIIGYDIKPRLYLIKSQLIGNFYL